MLRALWSQLQHRRRRAAAVAAGILVASVSFSLLTAATATSTAQVEGTVAQNLRPAYDILVRPPGSTTPLEANKGLVRDNYLSGIFGGITLQQYAQVKQIPGVQLAAPIAMIGYILQTVTLDVSVGGALTSSSQVLSVSDTRTSDNGLTRIPARSEGYVYVTADPIRNAPLPELTTLDGVQVAADIETLANGKHIVVCPQNLDEPQTSPFVRPEALTGTCWSSQDGYYGGGQTDVGRGGVDGYITETFPFLLAAIDPVAENQLVGLDGAVVNGRSLKSSDAPVTNGGSASITTTGHILQVPVLATTDPFVEDTDQITISRLPASAVTTVRGGLLPDQLAAALAKLPATPATSVTVTSQDAYQRVLHDFSDQVLVDAYWTADPVTYRKGAVGDLAPVPVTNPDSIWVSGLFGGYEQPPIEATDVGFRQLHEQLRSNEADIPLLTLHAVGDFDPAKLPGFSALSKVPLETYYPPEVSGADAASRNALGNKPLLPDANMAGYLQEPPLILTTLNSLSAFEDNFPNANRTAPISVIRVRVANVHGTVRQELAQIANVAAAIHRATGLDVDVTAGSSPTTETIALPPGRYGRPALTLDESWVRKAVALVILNAVDGKSAALFLLILVVCAFFIGNAAFAAVRVRRRELGVLRCLGWPRRTIFAFTLGEVILTGLFAGAVGTGLSAALIALLRLDVPWSRVALVTPVAVVLSGIAGFLPALQAARGQPLDAVAPAVRAPRRPRPVRRLAGLAWSNLRRTPGRAALAAAALAVGIAALTVLLALNLAFAQGIVGSELGGFVANQVRAVDYLSAALAVALGAASVADVLYINLRERAAEFAVLSAVGWQRGHVARVALGEGAGIGVAGSILGVAIGAGAAALILGPDLSLLALPAAVALVAGIIVTVIAASAVAASIRRLPLVASLAEE